MEIDRPGHVVVLTEAETGKFITSAEFRKKVARSLPNELTGLDGLTWVVLDEGGRQLAAVNEYRVSLSS